MNCTVTRTLPPERTTEPSTIPSTFSARAISGSGLCADLYCMTEVREITFSEPSLARCVMSSSVKPSARYSCAGSPDKFSRGKTAIERMGRSRFKSEVRRPKIFIPNIRSAKLANTATTTRAVRIGNLRRFPGESGAMSVIPLPTSAARVIGPMKR